MDTTTTVPKLLTEAEAADVLRVEPVTLRNWRWRRYGPDHVKVGGTVLYTAAALSEWIESRTRSTAGRNKDGASRTCACDSAGAHREGE